MNIFQEIIESRMYRVLSRVDGMSISDITERIFEHLLALQFLVYADPHAASEYASKIMQAQNFNGFRTTQPDLYNLLVLIMRQDQYDKNLKNNQSIVLPEFIIRRNLRDIADKQIDDNDYNNMMMILQRRMGNLTGRHITLRREISDYERLSDLQRTQVRDQLLLLMRERGVNSDLYQLLYNLK